ncbi:VaFE repeat-containing surface-anchored protein, partial [Bacillus thuringiensis]|uniref:VaFE repeat-containing surface-anchored protein n=1 Tax=Bacillus thuringiensis TaxID=1428 RepID=UPI001642A576
HFLVPKHYLLKPNLIHNSTNKPFLLHPKQLTPQHTFTPKQKHPFLTLHFTFHPSPLQPKQLLLFQHLYQNLVLL